MHRKAHAVWRGLGRNGTGDLTTQSGVLSKTPYTYGTRFEADPGTNPEELIAAAHAGCFTMALAFRIQSAGFTPTELRTEATIEMEPEGTSLTITRSRLKLVAEVPGIDKDTFGKLARDAELKCPVSRVLNAEVTLEWELRELVA